MSEWSSGYVTDLAYTSGYYPEMNPNRARLSLLLAGIAPPPRFETACELGFGQGVSIAVHAAAADTTWFGADVNPTHAANAHSLIAASGAGAHLHAENFEEFCSRTDLPEFDFIGLHGVWSWVGDENRARLADFFTRKLRVGGVVYVSYNTLPGWSAFAPIRHLLSQHVATQLAPGMSLEARVEIALNHVEKLLNSDPAFVRANPAVKERFAHVRKLDRRYLAHEYCNGDWSPSHFADMAKVLRGARLSYAGSTHALDHIDTMNFSPEQITQLRETQDWVYRETIRDLFLNTQFRRDLWVKGPTRLDISNADLRMKELPIVAMRQPGAINLKARVGRGEISIKPEIFQPIADFIAKERHTTIGACAAVGQAHGASLRAVVEGIALFASNNDIAVGCEASPAAHARAHRFNTTLATTTSFTSREVNLHFASPATGGAVTLPRLNAMALGVGLAGVRGDARIDALLAGLSRHGQKLSAASEGKTEREVVADLIARTDALAPLLGALKLFEPNSGAVSTAPQSSIAAAA